MTCGSCSTTSCRISINPCTRDETRAEHNEIEARMLYRSWQKEHTYRGFPLVRDYSCFAYQIAQNSSQHTWALFFDRDVQRVTEAAWAPGRE